MSTLKITSLSISLLLIVCLIILWILTGRLIVKGLLPEAEGKYEYSIILGAKVNGEIPSLSLQYRLDAALTYANKYPQVYLVLSGGQGPDEDISEAEAMKRFLVKNGIKEERLILESSSTSTYENILFSKKLLPDTIQTVTIITSDYHLARTRKIAKTLGLETDAIAAKTPKIVELKLRTRERVALLKTYIFGK